MELENSELNIDRLDGNNKDSIFDESRDDNMKTEKLTARKLDFLELERAEIDRRNDADSYILLYIPNAVEPIELSNITRVSLGRSDQNTEGEPTVDLNAYQAKLLGVSRFHAEIVYRDGAYYVSDLKSTNGTWVNHDSVTPDEPQVLRDGDTLRMGNFIIQVGLA